MKPDPRIFELALDALGVRAEAAWYLGDIPGIDVVGARRAGLRPFLIDPLDLHHDADFDRVDSLAAIAGHMSLIPHSFALGAGSPIRPGPLAQRHPSRSVGRGYADNMAEPFDPVSELSALVSRVPNGKRTPGPQKIRRVPAYCPLTRP